MSEKYKFVDEQGMYFVTMAVAGWVNLFTRWELKHVIIDSLRFHFPAESRLGLRAICCQHSPELNKSQTEEPEINEVLHCGRLEDIDLTKRVSELKTDIKDRSIEGAESGARLR